MKITRLALLLASVALASGCLRAATEVPASPHERARIVGRVQNGETGQYLSSARVSIKGTTLSALTDRTGTYRFASVPAGTAVLTAFFTGLDSQHAQLNVVAGQTLEQNFSLASASAIVQLEKVTVRGARVIETESINEQRFAPNLKLVAAPTIDEFVLEGNVGEFMKSLPGVSVEYWDDEIMGLSVRGFGSEVVGVTLDGAPIAGAAAAGGGSYRGVQMPNLSLNNISRVEVTLVPTPSTPADSLGGSINLVSKSAFERTTPRLEYNVFLSANQHAMTVNKSPDSYDQRIHKILPGFTFDYTLPASKNFGLVLALSRSQFFNEVYDLWDKSYATGGTGTGASISSPYLRSARAIYSPQSRTRTGGSIKADWRVTPNSVLSFGVQGVEYDNHWAYLNWYPDTGANGRSTTANGVAMTFGPDFTHGATGRGDIRVTGGFGKRKNASLGENVRWRFDDGTWRIEAGLTDSNSQSRFVGPSEGYFNGQRLFMNPVAANILGGGTVPVRVNLDGITASGPTSVQIFDNNNQPVDPANIQNYRLATVSTSPGKTESAVQGADASIRRQFDRFPFPVALQIGAAKNVRTNETRMQNNDYTFSGISGNAFYAPESLAPYLSLMANRPLGAGFPGIVNNIPWTSTRKLYAAWLKNPSLFTQTPAQIVSAERSRVTNSEWIQETVTAAYFQGESRLLANRLSLVTGVRWEQTKDVGLGPLVDPGAVFMRSTTGAFVRDAQGRQIRRLEAGAAGSLEELRLTTRERAARAVHTYDGYYPSLNATYHATEKFQVRLGWAKTYGRPDFYLIIPNPTINQANLTDAQLLDPARSRGTINVSNPALKPWSADNYDLSFEYYSDQGGLVTLGVFQKYIRDFFGSVVKPATADDLATLGLDSAYLGWNLSTQTNTDHARIGGVTLSFNQSLRAVGPLGRHFSVFGNGTQLRLKGDREADFWAYLKTTANWGFKFSARNFDGTARWNYRGPQKQGANSAFGPDAYDYTAATTFLDVTLAYRVRKQMVVYVNASNLLNEPRVDLTSGSQIPFYARQWSNREYGAQFTAGIKGAF